MKTIWKYKINLANTLEIPKDAKFLSLQIQDESNCLWFEVDTEKPKETRTFYVNGTGHPIRGTTYIGTFQNPPFVWHVYED